MSSFGPSPIPLDNVLGAAFIGIVMSTAIYGVTCLQVYLYYTQHCSRDSLFLKLYVAVLMMLESFHVALLTAALYWYTVTNFGDLDVLAHDTWSLLIEVVVGDIITGIVQCFFAYRIYNLSGKRIYSPITICVLAAVQFALAVVYVAKMFNLSLFSLTHEALPYSASSLAADLLNNIIIMVQMVYFLRRGRPKVLTEIHMNNRTVNLLISYALNTGFLATVLSFVTLITNVTMPDTMVYALFYFITIRLYSCAMMSTLNTRSIPQPPAPEVNKEFISFTRTTVVTEDVPTRPSDRKWHDPVVDGLDIKIDANAGASV